VGRSVARRTIENALRRLGLTAVAGVDEVGRGCLAGPVVAAAVVLDPRRHIPGLADSKVVPVQERETLYATIVTAARAWAVASVEPVEIDRLNIHRASLSAMRQAVLDLVPLPDVVIVDAFRIPDLPLPQRGIVKGDRRCAAIAAASIVAKVTRDRIMHELHRADSVSTITKAMRRANIWTRLHATVTRLHTGARFGPRHFSIAMRATSRCSTISPCRSTAKTR
jgi:ribonuclease HII